MNKLIITFFLTMIMISCGEEVITQNTQNSTFKSSELESFELSTCSQMTLRKPPVDILYVIDNTGSTLENSFQAIKSEIQKTVSTISSQFDYHIYFAPLNATSGDNITTYPLIVSDPDSIPSLSNVNQTNIENLNMFAKASGNNSEYGFSRVKNLIESNRANGIFRNNAHTIVLLISNGDDTEALTTVSGNKVLDSNKFTQIKNELLKFTSKYASANASLSNPLKAQSFRFISLVAHSSCNGWVKGELYKKMSNDIYDYQTLSDSSSKDSLDLCGENYSSIFSAVNSSIKSVIEGHKYDHWPISFASESSIQANDIQVIKVKQDNSRVEIPEDATDGFEYLGYKQDQKLTYAPADANEIASGLIIKLNGNARIEYPDCIIAKTRTPTEYFGYFALPKEPDLSTIEVKIAGIKYEQSTTDGWNYLGWRDTLNIKVPGPTNASVTPPLNKSGYMIQLNGNAIFSNGTTVEVFYKAKGK